MAAGFFIAGTDTGIGKTAITTGLMALAGQQGLQVSGMKPVASGAQRTAEGLTNEDALAIQRLCQPPLAYQQVNPVVFEAAASPDIAAELAGQQIDLDLIQAAYRALPGSSVHFIEGVGGWQVPLAAGVTMADLAVRLGLPVILVVGVRLGCINHALLTADAIRQSGLPLVAWVANEIEPDTEYKDKIINVLESRLVAPLVGVIPHINPLSPQDVAANLQIPSFQQLLS